MCLRELLLASGEWDWSAMELRAEGEVCGVEWMFGDRGSVCAAVDYSCLGNLRRGGSACILRYGEQKRMLQGGTARTTNNRMEVTGSDRRTACTDQACEVEVVADSGYLRRGMTEFPQRWAVQRVEGGVRKPGSQSGCVVGTGRTSWLPSRDVDSRGRPLRAR